MTLYICILLPLFLTLIGLGAQSFNSIKDVTAEVTKRYSTTPLPQQATIQQVGVDKGNMW